jgi:hypothetical protein
VIILFASQLAIIASAPCEKMIDLSGPTELVAEVRRHLTKTKDARCRKLRVALSEGPNGIDVALEVNNIIVNRIASTPEIAAVLIESWAASDGPRRVIRPRNEWIEPKPDEDTVTVAVEIEEEREPLVRITTDGELSVASNGSLWYGPSAHACMVIGYFCTGAEVRYARSGGELTAGHHAEGQARIEARLPLQMFTIEARVGAGLSHTNRLEHAVYIGPCERFSCSGPADLRTSRTGLAVSGGLGATVHATSWLGFALGLSISSGPLGRAPSDAGMWFFRVALGLKIEV